MLSIAKLIKTVTPLHQFSNWTFRSHYYFVLFKLNFDKKNKQISFIVNINNHLTDNQQKA